MLRDRTKQRREFRGKRGVDVGKRGRTAELCERGDAVPGVGHATRRDASEMRQIGRNIERESVQRHPALYADPDGGDLVFASLAFVRPAYPNADSLLAPFASHAAGRERGE